MRTKAHAHGRAPRAARRLVLVALLPALGCAALLPPASRPGASAQVRSPRKVSTPSPPARTAGGGEGVATTTPQPRPRQEPANVSRVLPATVTNVNFRALAAQQAQAARAARRRPPARYQAIHPPLTIDDSTQGGVPRARAGEATRQPAPLALDDPGGPLAPSPPPSSTYNAQEDGPKVDGPAAGLFNIPPDTQGAVGLDKVFTNTNPNYRVHDKTTGAPLSTVSTDTFWAGSGGSGFFDPRVVFDPYNLRWILAVVSNAQTANSSVVIAVSQTPDPQGSYNVYRFAVGCAGGTAGCDGLGEWADFPMLGFNKNWIAVSMNMFGLPNGSPHVNDKILVLDYPQARSGAANAYLFADDAIGFCNYPVETYDAAEPTLYFAQHLSSGDATYRITTLTGDPPAQPALNFGEVKVRPGGGWTQPAGDMLPQTCAGTPGVNCPTVVRRIDVLDAQVRGNAVFRNGGIYYAQTVALPAGAPQTTDPFGNQVSTADRTAAQWTRLDTSGNFVDGGRIEDAAATPTNGGRWYAYPSIAVNKHNDVLIGFSEFESDDFADAGYAVRLGTDAPGATRDPVIYKEGEDYYSKDFGGPRNRFGDYSATRIDPANDRDIWTVQEYAGTRTAPNNSSTTNNSRWGTWWAKVALPAAAGELLISEFRLRGPNGADDEFVEIYNASGSAHTVTTADGSAGYAVAAQDGVVRCVIPGGTVIPARGHFLCANSAGYSLGGHPAGGLTTATPDAAYTADIPDNSGVALFNTAAPSGFSAATRVDAVGFTTTPPGPYVEGTGLPALLASNVDHSFYRDACGKGGSITALGNCPTGGLPKETNDNAADFVFVEVNGSPTGAGQRLGAPGPENLSSPVQRNSQMAGANIDPAVGSSNPPNRVRDFTSNPGNNSTFGTLSIRKTITNNTGGPVTRLRFRVIDVTTFPSPATYADLRPRTSGPAVAVITGTNAACPGGTCAVQGTTLEQPPAQPNGGGFNSTLAAGAVTLAQPLANGASVNVQFLLGIQQTGAFKFFINVEVLP